MGEKARPDGMKLVGSQCYPRPGITGQYLHSALGYFVMVVHAGSDVRGKGYATSYRLTLSGSASDTTAGRSRHYKEPDEILQTNIVYQSSWSKT